jgi:hypothetical protein
MKEFQWDRQEGGKIPQRRIRKSSGRMSGKFLIRMLYKAPKADVPCSDCVESLQPFNELKRVDENFIRRFGIPLSEWV